MLQNKRRKRRKNSFAKNAERYSTVGGLLAAMLPEYILEKVTHTGKRSRGGRRGNLSGSFSQWPKISTRKCLGKTLR
jgi:hypothetical protein